MGTSFLPAAFLSGHLPLLAFPALSGCLVAHSLDELANGRRNFKQSDVVGSCDKVGEVPWGGYPVQFQDSWASSQLGHCIGLLLLMIPGPVYLTIFLFGVLSGCKRENEK